MVLAPSLPRPAPECAQSLHTGHVGVMHAKPAASLLRVAAVAGRRELLWWLAQCAEWLSRFKTPGGWHAAAAPQRPLTPRPLLACFIVRQAKGACDGAAIRGCGAEEVHRPRAGAAGN